ncbi:origin recognition complex subunit 1 [Sugiyamaella lignohabitans]|uniref:Origin recognition complex subunit 1 n=1 Tax=Sugiyamaella lignohabitans TaxID=796027 RepID=A0A167C2H4_9ASCO|nr:origin recognition complex subunit 1 [Sugiyamaella lignohabitans]ANB11139.1 origin recognition complex subunit 1 [Sugiyamaella lignohabitans]
MSDEDEWKYIYPSSENDAPDDESPRKRRTGLRNTSVLSPIGVRRLADEQEFYVGDCVLLDSGSDTPYVGIIESFFFSEKGFMETRTIWFRRFSEITRQSARKNAPENLEGELFATPDMGRDSLDILLEPAIVLSYSEYQNRIAATSDTPIEEKNTFFCRRTFNSDRGLFGKEDFDWSTVYAGRGSDMLQLLANLEDLTPSTRKKTATPRASPAKKQPPKKKIIELSSSDEEDELLSGSDSDEFFDTAEDKAGIRTSPSPTPSKRKRTSASEPKTPTKSRKKASISNTPKTPKSSTVSPVKKRSTATPRRKLNPLQPTAVHALPVRMSPTKQVPTSPHKFARDVLHVATVPDSLPCRESEFSQIFLALESAISSESGTCVYISGTPGTGKTATVREVIAQLQLRVEDEELPAFKFVEINGMKLTNPHTAYEILYENISNKKAAAATAMVLLEKQFKSSSDNNSMPVVVLMDELDQLVTKNQGVMYNFFNWPTFSHSKLIVVAVANTMDLPERMLSNKISSRLGLTRIQFPGYSHEQLREIISTRLANLPEGAGIVEKDAIEFASRKIAGVSGDARRALDICRRAVELAQPEEEEISDTLNDGEKGSLDEHKVTIDHIKKAIAESTSSPTHTFLRGLSMSAKILVCAMLSRVRRSGLIDNPLGDVLQETERIVKLSNDSEKLTAVLFNNNRVRIAGFQYALNELIEGGVLLQQMLRGERSANIRLSIGEEYVKSAFKNDLQVAGML